MKLENPDLIFLTEMLPKNVSFEVDFINLCILGFQLFVSPNSSRGTGVYVKEGILVSEVCFNEFVESVWLHLKLCYNESLLVGCVYRSPASINENNLLLHDLLNKVNEYNASSFFSCWRF